MDHGTTYSYRDAGRETVRDLPGVPVPVRDDAPAANGASGTSVWAGEKFGRYVVNRAIGKGGMGVVFGAIDPDLDRRVAIKLVHVNGSGPRLRYATRLRREAMALARLSHPNIVAIYDIGRTNRGAFIAMEYLSGVSLRKWLAQEPRTCDDIVSVMVQAGKGLAAAHAAGVIHRDFKPTNIMCCHDGQVKVLDFGLARGTPKEDPWIRRDDDEPSLLCRRLTRTDVIVGTTGYMSPEQLLGGEIGPWTDQYAFCVVLWEALYRKRPFDGDTPALVAHQMQAGPPACPAAPNIPQRIRDTLRRGLSTNPRERFASMADLLAALITQPPRRWKPVAGVAGLFLLAWLSALGTLWAVRAIGESDDGMCEPVTAGIAPP